MEKDPLLETIAVYDQLGAKYADQIAHVRLPQLQEFIGMLPKGSRVLDVGCAAGRDSAILHDAGFRVFGIDLSDRFLDLARERVSEVEFGHIDVRALGALGRDVFDGVWANAVLLNLDRLEIPGVLWEFREALKPGGICYVGVKVGTGEKFIGEPLVDNMKRRETYFEQSEMELLFKAAGFDIVKSYIYRDELGRSTTQWVCVFGKKKS